MKLTDIKDLPFNSNENIRVKVLDIKNDILSFLYRDKSSEYNLSVNIPRNKIWKKANIKKGSKINLILSSSPIAKKIQLTFSY